mmetsp:Transcript_61042/g.108666  ORF Transcript_61042/g.108666 Transcript_61042/m.108666 type:complete len:243 (+) Transcript_61042:1352-2080(+)
MTSAMKASLGCKTRRSSLLSLRLARAFGVASGVASDLALAWATERMNALFNSSCGSRSCPRVSIVLLTRCHTEPSKRTSCRMGFQFTTRCDFKPSDGDGPFQTFGGHEVLRECPFASALAFPLGTGGPFALAFAGGGPGGFALACGLNAGGSLSSRLLQQASLTKHSPTQSRSLKPALPGGPGGCNSSRVAAAGFSAWTWSRLPGCRRLSLFLLVIVPVCASEACVGSHKTKLNFRTEANTT